MLIIVDVVLLVSTSTHVTSDLFRPAVTGLIVKLDFTGWTPEADTLEKVAVVELITNGWRVAVAPADETSLVSEGLLNNSHCKNIPDVVQVTSS